MEKEDFPLNIPVYVKCPRTGYKVKDKLRSDTGIVTRECETCGDIHDFLVTEVLEKEKHKYRLKHLEYGHLLA